MVGAFERLYFFVCLRGGLVTERSCIRIIRVVESSGGYNTEKSLHPFYWFGDRRQRHQSVHTYLGLCPEAGTPPQPASAAVTKMQPTTRITHWPRPP